jgi:ATPase subunit of ABC transporter with duplicated ATPase domains
MLTRRQIGKLAEDHKNFKVLIGVAGKTGAGKSTILNTLLEIPELLPSSNSEASTACVCLVSWNPDDTPGRKLRAVVCFRSVEDVKSELDDIFARVRKREEGKAVETETEDSDAVLNRVDEDAEEQRAIAEGFKKIKAVWGLEEDAALSMSSQQILDYKPEVLELLGTTKEIYSDDPDTFSEQVKPYMDSSENLQKFRA